MTTGEVPRAGSEIELVLPHLVKGSERFRPETIDERLTRTQ